MIMYCYFYLNSFKQNYKNNCLLWRVSRFCAIPGIIWKIVLICLKSLYSVYKIKFYIYIIYIYIPEKYYAQYSVPNLRKRFTPTIIQLSCAAAS